MNKSELIDDVADKTSASKKEVNAILDAILGTIVDTVAEGEKVVLVGFGCFESRDRAARDGRNPKTGQTMKLPATVVPVFSAGKQFREAVKP
ncbi:MAG: HU family DNA-binding protein [Microcoleus sp. PH2017_10_PVI_O_A]|uniref:HU family DNA-binding protein n=1 Tax=unclassified Microcoleus TaxID=2642155 RepID=UPI001DBCC54F|nr:MULTISPECIES: HU family DNA-binding protein [unclassified Microcoleus]MCC3410160.1 HU family DNA-binding protein [Microcoleus sp. PH2017_10_PVI_O_A]MCC3476499.1 HU family DNA-binding protein [Microcoleus sp. PH2017_12_PCY_D_A]MCC3563732.1 HU family DNA-binding protein [Microcoleus sp. PH2017_27_LUM_O_A]